MVETTFRQAASESEIELLAKKEALKMLAKMQGVTEDEMERISAARKQQHFPSKSRCWKS